MLYRFPVKEMKAGALSKRYGYSVIVMQYYPRFVSKELVNEYLRSLAPPRELFTEFKKLDRELKSHDLAFERCRYEERFQLSEQGVADLERLAALSREQDVYLLCQCLVTEKCHADLLLLWARNRLGAHTQTLRHRYPRFEKRPLESLLHSPLVSASDVD